MHAVDRVAGQRAAVVPEELEVVDGEQAELLVQWLGPRDLTLTVDRYDVRDGGRWRYVHTDAQGNAYVFHGVFHGDPSPQAIVQTFEFEGAPGHVKLDATTLEERGSKTLVRTVSSFGSVADRDAMIASGVERGTRDSGERLQELLTRLQGS